MVMANTAGDATARHERLSLDAENLPAAAQSHPTLPTVHAETLLGVLALVVAAIHNDAAGSACLDGHAFLTAR